MIRVCPQTPKASSGRKTKSLSTRACSPSSGTIHKIKNDDDIPDLGLDDTPLSNNSIPPTPNDSPLACVSSVSKYLQSSPSKLAESRNAVQALYESDIIPDKDSLSVEEYLQQEVFLNQPADWLSRIHNSNISAGNKSRPIKAFSRKYPAIRKDFGVPDLNFSKQITTQGRRSTKRSYCATTQQTKSLTTADGEAARSTAFICTEEIANSLIDGQSTDHSVSARNGKPRKTTIKSMEISTTFEFGKSSSRHILPEKHTQSSEVGNVTHESAQSSVEKLAKISRNLDRVLPYEAFQRLNYDLARCISTTTRHPYERCKHRTKLTQDGIDRLKQIIRDNDDLSSLEGAEQLIRDIIELAMCSRSHIELANRRLTELLHYISGEARENNNHARKKDRLSSSDVNAIGNWIDASLRPFISSDYEYRLDRQYVSICEQSTESRITSDGLEHQGLIHTKTTQASRVTRSTISAARTVIEKGAQFKVNICSSTAIGQMFEPYTWPRKNCGLSVESIVESVLLKPLTPCRDMSDGYIYIYWIPGNFGYVKIGVTTRSDTEARLKEWKQKCGHDIASHGVIGAGVTDESELIAIPHVYRVEKLIHAELLNFRQQEVGCVKCGTKHNEWFKVDAEYAKEVIRRWARWIKQEMPYELRTTPGARAAARSCSTKAKKDAYKPTWELKESISDEMIESMTKPVDLPPKGQLLVPDQHHDRPKTPLSGRRASSSTPRRSPVKDIALDFSVKTESKVKIRIEEAVHTGNVPVVEDLSIIQKILVSVEVNKKQGEQLTEQSLAACGKEQGVAVDQVTRTPVMV